MKKAKVNDDRETLLNIAENVRLIREATKELRQMALEIDGRIRHIQIEVQRLEEAQALRPPRVKRNQ